MQERINTGLMDSNRQYIHTGDILIIGDNPDKQKEYLVRYSNTDKIFWATETVRDNLKISYKLETIHENAYIKPPYTNIQI